jgi:hypothetical protein
MNPDHGTSEAEFQRKTWCMGLYAGVDYIASPYHIYHGQPYAGVDLNTMPESTLSRCQGLRIWPQISSTIEGHHTLSRCSWQCCGSGMICPDLAFQGRAGSGS